MLLIHTNFFGILDPPNIKELDVVLHEGSWLGCESCWMHVVAPGASTGSILVDQIVDPGGSKSWILVDVCGGSMSIPVADLC